MEVTELALLVDIIRGVFHTYKRTYDSDSDVVSVKVAAAVCLVLPFFWTPVRWDGRPCSKGLTFQFYIDVFVLVPQVVMMGKQSIPVQSPIAHYVVALAFTRVLDLWYWIGKFHVFDDGILSLSFSGFFII